MSKPLRCAKCGGLGSIEPPAPKTGFGRGPVDTWPTCKACKGSGWIETSKNPVALPVEHQALLDDLVQLERMGTIKLYRDEQGAIRFKLTDAARGNLQTLEQRRKAGTETLQKMKASYPVTASYRRCSRSAT